MQCGTAKPLLVSFVLLLNRLSLGLFFAIAGYNKIQGGVDKFIETAYKPMTPPWLPAWFATPYGHAVPYLELILGGLLVFGLLTRLVSVLITLMLISFTIAMIHAGYFFTPPGTPFNSNLILCSLAMLLALTGPGSFSLDSRIRCGSCCSGSAACPPGEPKSA